MLMKQTRSLKPANVSRGVSSVCDVCINKTISTEKRLKYKTRHGVHICGGEVGKSLGNWPYLPRTVTFEK